MKLNRKGFAVTGIIYSMLILFLALVLLILSNLASRKVLFDKEKNEILEKINGAILCTAIEPNMQNVWNRTINVLELKTVGVAATSETPYAVGSVYTCDLGDGARTFYVLKEDEDNVKLIMNENLGGTVAWIESGDNHEGPVTASAYLTSQTSGWTKLTQNQITLPDAQDLADAMGDTEWNDANYTGKVGPTWMYVNLDENNSEYAYIYWTSTPYSNNSYTAWCMTSNGSTSICSAHAYHDSGVRPVITISKSNLAV